MKTFGHTFTRALWGRDYKKDFGQKTFWQGFWYVSILILLQLVIFFAVVGLRDVRPILAYFFDRTAITEQITSRVPDTLDVSIKEGVVTTGDGLPIVIQMDDQMKVETGLDNILVVNPTITENTTEAFKSYKTAALLTANTLIMYEDDGRSIKESSLKDYPDMNITRDSIIAGYEMIRPFVFWGIVIGTPILLLLLYGTGIVAQLIFVLILALITLLIAKIKRTALTYAQAYVISLYALTWLIFIEVIINLFVIFPLGLLTIPFFILIIALHLRSEKEISNSITV